MRELSACDFCGGEAAGVYEVVPGDIPGVSARRMVLCEGCRDTLADIVDPLLDAGRAGGRAKAKRGSEVSHSATMSEPESESAAVPEPATEPDAAAESDAAADSTPEPDAGASVDPEPAAEPESESKPDPEPAPEPGPQPADGESAEPAAAEPEPVERPAEYGKVVRLVENRDDGIPRSDLEELATSAYGLSHGDVEEAIDFALEHGTFEETSSGLKTT